MSNVLDFDLKREGFPVKIGSLEFFFGTSYEDLTRFFEVQESLEEQEKVALKRISDSLNTENPTPQEGFEVLEAYKAYDRLVYDALLGEGAYDKIYEVFPYADILYEKFDVIIDAVVDRVQEETEKRADKYQKQRAKLLAKKKKKAKKK